MLDADEERGVALLEGADPGMPLSTIEDDARATDIFCEVFRRLQGISAISLAGILGEAGDLSGFVHGNALLRHAGLNLAEASSGKWMKISKRGRSRLRRFIFMMTMSLVANNSEFKAMHAYNVQIKKMKKMRSIMKLCGKLARILVGMARSGEAYNPPKTLPIQLAA